MMSAIRLGKRPCRERHPSCRHQEKAFLVAMLVTGLLRQDRAMSSQALQWELEENRSTRRRTILAA